MIKEIIDKYENVSFLCKTFDDIKIFINTCQNEGIVFSKTISQIGTSATYIQEHNKIFERYTRHLDPNFESYVLIVKAYVYSEKKYEYQFYTRSSKEKGHDDWNKYEKFNFTKMIRSKKINTILKHIR